MNKLGSCVKVAHVPQDVCFAIDYPDVTIFLGLVLEICTTRGLLSVTDQELFDNGILISETPYFLALLQT